MKRLASPRDVVLGGLFLALALVLPTVFHLFGAGKVFLPMHIPIFLAGFMVTPWVAGVVGLVAPLLSSVLTGMPPLSPPVAQVMAAELAVYGLATAFLYRATRRVILSWILAAFAGRLAAGLAGAGVLPLLGLQGTPLLYPLTTAVVAGLPGLALQAVLVPGVVYLVQRIPGFGPAPARPGRGGATGSESGGLGAGGGGR
ncbi:MAG: ECF transporter S component [Firmicutes bacterium]|nr:ECF transporter S component [Bacillota bacterium]